MTEVWTHREIVATEVTFREKLRLDLAMITIYDNGEIDLYELPVGDCYSGTYGRFTTITAPPGQLPEFLADFADVDKGRQIEEHEINEEMIDLLCKWQEIEYESFSLS
jgi:hypothetical protein